MAGNQRDRQRAATEAAIVDAAWHRFASRGPDGSSIREVASDAGCTHGLVARYFGSKDGLVAGVAHRLTQRVDALADAAMEAALAGDGDPIVGLLGAARRDRPTVQLLVRSALGDLGEEATNPPARLAELALVASGATPGARVGRGRRTRAYAAASLLLGWLTYERFVVVATGLSSVRGRALDTAIAGSIHRVAAGTGASRPPGAAALQVDPALLAQVAPAPSCARDALVTAAVELFAARGPASVSVRDVARHAGVNQGLIYRHLGSKDALIAAAFEEGSSDLFPAALAPAGFDIDTVIHQVHHGARAPRLIARLLVDDVEVQSVRQEFPILRRLLDAYQGIGPGGRAPDATDPRIAVAAVTCMAMGSAVHGPALRAALDVADPHAAEAAIAASARQLLAVPFGPSDPPARWR